MSRSAIQRFEAVFLHRGHVVVEQPSKSMEAGPFTAMDEARAHAAALNGWLASRPTRDTRYPWAAAPPEPTEAALFALVDRLYAAEGLADRLADGLGARVAEEIGLLERAAPVPERLALARDAA